MCEMKVMVNNGQTNPYVDISTPDEEVRIYFCRDGGIIKAKGKSLGVYQGARFKQNQCEFEEAPEHDGIEIS